MTTPDPADVHTGTDRVELTDAEREGLIEAIQNGDHDNFVESIVAARLARYGEPLIEVYETDGIDIVRKNLHDLRAELAAANARCAEWEASTGFAAISDLVHKCNELRGIIRALADTLESHGLKSPVDLRAALTPEGKP